MLFKDSFKLLYLGEIFGEVVLVWKCSRIAIVVAASLVIKFWVFDWVMFYEMFKCMIFEWCCEYMGYLEFVVVFCDLFDVWMMLMLVDAFRMTIFESGVVIVSLDDFYDEIFLKFYVIVKGELVVYVEDGELFEVNRLKWGDYFGEVSLIYKISFTATVVVVG